MKEREKEIGVAPRPDEEVTIGDLRRLGEARIDDHQLAAARAQGREAPAHVGRRHDAPLETTGFAPTTRKNAVRSMSGIGKRS